jgi:hypothetical protein
MGQQDIWRTIDNLFLGTICFQSSMIHLALSFFRSELNFQAQETFKFSWRREVNLAEDFGRTFHDLSRFIWHSQGIILSICKVSTIFCFDSLGAQLRIVKHCSGMGQAEINLRSVTVTVARRLSAFLVFFELPFELFEPYCSISHIRILKKKTQFLSRPFWPISIRMADIYGFRLG